MAAKQEFLPEKLSKFNSTLHSDSLIACQIKHLVSKIFASRFRLPPQYNGALQNYSILRPGYRSVRFLDTKCTVGILRTYGHPICAEKRSTLNCTLQENAPLWQCAEWMHKRTIVSLTHMAKLTTIYWILLLRPYPVIGKLLLCSNVLHG